MPQRTRVSQAHSQAAFLQGDIVETFLPGTGAARLGEPEAAWTTPVCRVMTRVFNCTEPKPITRSPFCDTTK
jgi:hypothetical protein